MRSRKAHRSMPSRNLQTRRLIAEWLEARQLLAGPYAPAADMLGSGAIGADDPNIDGWATEVADYLPGGNVDAQFQTPEKSIGPAEGSSGGIVALGRGGQITLTFDAPIRNGLGPDFAVFENGFSDTFLELGYVEVSSDGVNFFRFSTDSLTPSAVDEFGELDPTNIAGLAGKYRQGFGTPFDLQELSGVDPLLNVNAVTHVRVVDVIGDGTNTDTSGDPIYDPFPTSISAGFDLDAIAVLNQSTRAIDTVGFEDLGASLTHQSAFDGPVSGGTTTTGPFGDTIIVGDIQSEALSFENRFSLDFQSWSGWGYSNQTNNTSLGFSNQFSSFAGGGGDGSATFGVSFVSPPSIVRREAADDRLLDSIQITNTTYTALSMANGDDFAKKFGGALGNDPDFLLLTIKGKDLGGNEIGSVEFALADYRFADNSLDYIVDDWVTVDLSSISSAHSLEFTIDSSDVGDFGINTPTYVAADNIRLIRPSLRVDIKQPIVSEAAGSEATTVRVSRVDADTTDSLDVTIVASDTGLASAPTIVTIPAGSESVDFFVSITDNDSGVPNDWVLFEATADGFESASGGLTVQNDDAPPITVDAVTFSESDSAQAADFEDLGKRLGAESFYNGADLASGFESEGIVFSNEFSQDYDSWSGWAYSNTTDTTTPGFLNQYSSIVGSGARGSDTYGVAAAFGDAATISRDPAGSIGFDSIAITNTTYAALSMRNGDVFAKKFGGDSGDDPDFLLLTIEGRDVNDDSLGTVEFYLADFRFADNSFDYIVDEWTTVDLSAISDAVSLSFALSSSDVGEFGINTPAYFAADDVMLQKESNSTVPVRRGDTDLSTDLMVQISSSNPDLLVVPEFVIIPSGFASVDAPVKVLDDALVDGTESVNVVVGAVGHTGSSTTIEIEDDDVPTLTATFSVSLVGEDGGAAAATLIVHRNTIDLSSSLEIAISADDMLTIVDVFSIAAFNRFGELEVGVIDNVTLDGDRDAAVSAIRDGFVSVGAMLTIADDEIADLLIQPADQPISVTEAADGSEFEVSLAAQPLSNVFVDLVSQSDDVSIDLARLVFEPENWDQSQTVAVSAIPDLQLEDTESFEIILRVDPATSEPTYRPQSDSRVTVVVVDHQPTSLRLEEDAVSIQLRDEVTDVIYRKETHDDGIDIVASDRVQSLYIDSLDQTNGPVDVDLAGGNDTVTLAGSQFSSLSGGPGYDRLRLNLQQSAELVDLMANRVVGFEEVDVINESGAGFSVNIEQLGSITLPGSTLVVRNESDQPLTFVGEGVLDPPLMIGQDFAQVISAGDKRLHVITDRPWQNVLNQYDVDRSGGVSATDALVIILYLPTYYGSPLPQISSLDQFAGYFLDVSGDGKLTAIDALHIVNALGDILVESESGWAIFHETPSDQLADEKRLSDPIPPLNAPMEKLIAKPAAHDTAIRQVFVAAVTELFEDELFEDELFEDERLELGEMAPVS